MFYIDNDSQPNRLLRNCYASLLRKQGGQPFPVSESFATQTRKLPYPECVKSQISLGDKRPNVYNCHRTINNHDSY